MNITECILINSVTEWNTNINRQLIVFVTKLELQILQQHFPVNFKKKAILRISFSNKILCVATLY